MHHTKGTDFLKKSLDVFKSYDEPEYLINALYVVYCGWNFLQCSSYIPKSSKRKIYEKLIITIKKNTLNGL